MVRRDKLNSQFIVTKFSILRAGGRSLFRFQTSRESPPLLELEIVEAPPSNYSARGGGANVPYRSIYFTVLHLKFENFGENLKIHADGEDKLRIQFAPP